MKLIAAFLLGVVITLAVCFYNADTLYAWYWNTFIYRSDK